MVFTSSVLAKGAESVYAYTVKKNSAKKKKKSLVIGSGIRERWWKVSI